MKLKHAALLALSITLLALLAWAASASPTEENAKIVEDIITLNKLQKDYEYGSLYGPVDFTHYMHTMIAGQCSTCHHFFDHHMTEGVIVESMRTDDHCKKCHHMDSEPFTNPMKCILCHPEGVEDKIATLGNFPCEVCHELEKSFDNIRLIELEDGTIFEPPSLQAVYHRNCFKCHTALRKNDAGKNELACDKCHKSKAE